MGAPSISFKSIIESIYDLPLEERQEIKNLLDRNILESRREEILSNATESKKEKESGKLKFSSNISELKEML